MGRTLYDKIWDEHVVHTEDDGTSVLYIDRHLVHEVTSPQAFEGLDIADRKVWRISANLAVSDHNVPTTDRSRGIADPVSRLQVDTLDANCDRFGITQFKMNDRRQGIVHVIVLFNSSTKVHGRKQGKDISLQQRYEQLQKVHESSERHAQWTNCNALKNKD